MSEKSTEEGKAVYISLERGMGTETHNGCVSVSGARVGGWISPGSLRE